MLAVLKKSYEIIYAIDIIDAIQILILNYLQYFIKENQVKEVVTLINNF